jgi:hypothetical protein
MVCPFVIFFFLFLYYYIICKVEKDTKFCPSALQIENMAMGAMISGYFIQNEMAGCRSPIATTTVRE